VCILTAALGLRPDVPAGTLQVAPLAPSPFGALQVTGLRLAGHELSVAIDAAGAVLAVPTSLGSPSSEPPTRRPRVGQRY
jgi:hypothetical protein